MLELADSQLELVDSSTNSNADPMRIDEWVQALRLQTLLLSFYKSIFHTERCAFVSYSYDYCVPFEMLLLHIRMSFQFKCFELI